MLHKHRAFAKRAKARCFHVFEALDLREGKTIGFAS